MPEALPRHVIDAILTDYRDGLSAREVAARNGVSNATVTKHARRAGMRRGRPAPSPRPTVACCSCGAPCRSARGMCWICRELSLSPQDFADVALEGGRWVPRGGIRVWVPDGEAEVVSIHTAAAQLGVSIAAIEKAVERTRKAVA